MILTGKSRSTGIKACPSATEYPINLRWTALGLKRRLSRERPTTSVRNTGEFTVKLTMLKLEVCHFHGPLNPYPANVENMVSS